MRNHVKTAIPRQESAAPAWTWVMDANGRRYVSDEFNHRIVVEEPFGKAWTFGQKGEGAGDLRFPRGLALSAALSASSTRLYVADTWNHRVQVFDGRGELKFSFGGIGNGPGQFRAPSDLVIAHPVLPFEGDKGTVTAPVLVVADQWNARVQMFDLDGVWLGTLAGRPKTDHAADVGTGWPFFRLAEAPLPRDPVRLAWHAPNLLVTGGNGRVHKIDLAAALLPSLDEWRAGASAVERHHALRYFALLKGQRRAIPADVLASLASQTE
jgi:DNA-binding beta-propeller fold protein YncE